MEDHEFRSNHSSRQRLAAEYKEGLHGVVVLKTLQEWIGEQSSNATFKNLIVLLRQHDLINLCDNLLNIVENIRNAQLQIARTAASENGRRINFWFVMSDPIPVTNFVGKVDDLRELHKLVTGNRDDKDSSVALLAILHGFGGIGKTTLAIKYAYKYGDEFDGIVIWIDAEKFDSMKTAFENVAAELHLERDKIAKLDLKGLTTTVYKAFVGSKCLFIFDNVEDFDGPNGIEQFLPIGIARIGKPFLLLTSRRKDWKPFMLQTSGGKDCVTTKRIYSLPVLSESDSIELIQQYIPGATNEIAEKLAKRLERVPLAILQAIAYFKKSFPEHNLSSERHVLNKINSFLQEYKNNSNTILKCEFKGGDGYANNVFSICEMSLQSMEREEGGRLACHMLRYISFLHQDHIQLDFVLNLDYNFESIFDKLWRSIPWNTGMATDPNMTVDLLRSYSLIDINDKERTIKVHRLVQDVIRCKLQQKEELFYVKRLLVSLNKEDGRKNLSHYMSIKRSCRFEVSKDMLRGPFIVTHV